MGGRFTMILRPIKVKRVIKKSQGFEAWFFVIAALLAAALVFLILNKAWGSIRAPLETGIESSLEGKDQGGANITKILDQTGSTTRTFDKLMPFLIIGLFAFVMIGAGAIIRHPIMIFVGIIILGVVITLAVIYSNVYTSIGNTEEFADTTADLPIQAKFMQYLPVIVFLMAIAIVISIVYAKNSGGGGL